MRDIDRTRRAGELSPFWDRQYCRCGHDKVWHSHGGVGDCEHDGDCDCGQFAPQQTIVPVVLNPEAVGDPDANPEVQLWPM